LVFDVVLTKQLLIFPVVLAIVIGLSVFFSPKF
jgi:hypothetical protein